MHTEVPLPRAQQIEGHGLVILVLPKQLNRILYCTFEVVVWVRKTYIYMYTLQLSAPLPAQQSQRSADGCQIDSTHRSPVP